MKVREIEIDKGLPALVNSPKIRVMEVKCRIIKGRSAPSCILHSVETRQTLLSM